MTVTANHNPTNFKENENFNWHTIWLQCPLILHTFFLSCIGIDANIVICIAIL